MQPVEPPFVLSPVLFLKLLFLNRLFFGVEDPFRLHWLHGESGREKVVRIMPFISLNFSSLSQHQELGARF